MITKTIKTTFLILLLLTTEAAWAQSGSIRGQVTDAKTGAPISGAVIKTIPHGKQLISNNKGEFTIPKSQGAKPITGIEVKAVGYKPSRQTNLSGHVLKVALEEDIFHVAELVTIATRTPKPLEDVPNYTRVIRRKEIENMGAVSLVNILESELPGIEFKTHFNQVQVDMQGFGAGSVLFLVNGERIAIGEQSNVDYMRFPPQDIERIEIIKSSASALYGSNAVGGVINIITRKVDKPLSILLDNQYRSTKEYLTHLSIGAKLLKNLSSRTSMSHQKLGGYYIPFREESIQGVDTTYNYNISQMFRFTPTQDLSMELTGSAFKRKRLDDDPRLASLFNGYRSHLTTSYRLNDQTSVSGSYLWDYYSKSIYNKHETQYKYIDGEDRLHSFRVQGSHHFQDNNYLMLGVEFLHETFKKENQVKEDKSTDVFSFYAQHDLELYPKLNAVYGIRLDKHSTFGLHLSPKLSLMYKWDRFTFRGTYSNSFSAPTIKQLYMDFNHSGGGIAVFKMIGNKNLKPQMSHDFNLSCEYTNGGLNISLMAFHNRFVNKIVEHRMKNPNGGGVLIQWDNSGKKSSVTGSEAQIRVRLPYHFAFKAGYTYSYVYNPIVIPSGEKTANQTYTRPHMALARLEYNQSINKDWKVYASLWGKFASKLEYDEWNRTEITKISTEGYSMVNAQARIRYKNHIELYAEAANITNYIPNSYTFNAPLVVGRNMMIGLQLKY